MVIKRVLSIINVILFILFSLSIIWPLSLIGRVPDCHLGGSQFESGRGRIVLFILLILSKGNCTIARSVY